MAHDPNPTAPARRWRWFAIASALWAVTVVAAAYVSPGRDEPTVREQTSVAEARATVDRAVSGVVAAAGPDAVVSVSPFTRLGTCRISAVRDGEEWEQVVVLYTREGGEGPLLERLAAELPPEYGARARHGTGGRHTLRADAGDFVAVSGGVAAPGEIRISVTTGCRPGMAEPAAAQPDPGVRGHVLKAFTVLDVAPARWSGYEVPCAAGGAVRVVTAGSEPGVSPGPLPSRLRSVAPNAVLVQPEVYAYRAGEVSVVARLRDGAVVVTATTPCAG